jgi:hypothetical protein
MALQPLDLGPFFRFRNVVHRRQDSLDGGSAPRYTQDSINTKWTHSDIHAASVIGTREPSVWAGEDGSRLRSLGHCGRYLYAAKVPVSLKNT